MGTLRVPANDPRICVKGDNVVAAAIVSRDGTTKKELSRTTDGQAHVVTYDRKEEDKDDKLVILQTVAGGGLLATVFGILSPTGSSGSGDSGRPGGADSTGPSTTPSGSRAPFPSTTTPGAPDASVSAVSPAIDTRNLLPVLIKGNSAAVSVQGRNLLGINPEDVETTLENSKKIVSPNLVVATGSQNISVFDRVFESRDIGERFDCVVRTSEGSAQAAVTTAGLSGVSVTPECVTPGVVSQVSVDTTGFEALDADERIVLNLSTTPGATLLSPPVVATTKAALAACAGVIGQITTKQTGRHEVMVTADFPDLQKTGPSVERYGQTLR